MCDVDVRSLLAAAHIIPVADDGPDDARNGLVLCALHHLAFDTGLIRVKPADLSIEIDADYDMFRLSLRVRNLRHLPKIPRHEPLKWLRQPRWARENWRARTYISIDT